MTPEYLEDLADKVDADQLWRLSLLDQMRLPPFRRERMDMGVALRRHADDLRRLNELVGTGKSLLLTPLGLNGRASMTVPTPPEHLKLIRGHSTAAQPDRDDA